MAFTIESRLGRGRSVETFAAVLTVGTERLDVVVKRARPEFGKNKAFQDALLAWGNAQKSADHEHLVAVLEAGTTPEGVYVIQEKVEGAALATVLKRLRRRKRTLKPAFALIIAEMVANALQYLHKDLGVAHGGIDPGEVLIGYDGDVKLGDQKLRELDTHVGSDLIEPDDRSDYLSPERRNGEPPSVRSDLYAFGLMVLEMLIGHPVWMAESMSVDETLSALRDFSPIGQAQPDLTRELIEALGSCLETRHDKRPLNAVPVAKAIAELNARHGITPDGAGLGKFVEALVPPPEAEEAPTQMFDPEFAEKMAKKQEERLSQWEGLSVAINPEIERKLAEAKHTPLAASTPIVGKTVELGIPKTGEKEAPEPSPPPEPAPREPSAPPPAREPSAPLAPSVKREASVPAVHRVAVAANERVEASQRRTMLLAAVAVLVLGVVIAGLVAMSGPEERIVRLSAKSIPTGATVFDGRDDRLLGQTPLEMDVEVLGELLELRFELDGHEPHTVSIGGEREIRYEAKMTKSAE